MIHFFSLLLAIVLSSSKANGNPAPGGVIYAAAPEERGAFYVGGKGVYNYGYNTGDGIAKVEVRNADGSVTGSYRYFDPLGQQIVRSYIADKRGFRVLGNELPISPDTPAVGILNAQTLTGPVEGTQEFGTLNVQSTNENVAQNQIDTSSRFTSDTPNAYTEAAEKYNQVIMAQEELIRKQQETLATLKAQKLGFEKQQLQTPAETKLQVQTTQNGYFSNIVDSLGSNSPYFYAPDNFNYDFPAGFAYNSPGVYYSVAYPVGVKGHESPSLLTAGHTASTKRVHTSSAPTREYRPYADYDYISMRAPSTVYQRRPYVIGHYK